MVFQNIKTSNFSRGKFPQIPLVAHSFGAHVISSVIKKYHDFTYLKGWTVSLYCCCCLFGQVHVVCNLMAPLGDLRVFRKHLTHLSFSFLSPLYLIDSLSAED